MNDFIELREAGDLPELLLRRKDIRKVSQIYDDYESTLTRVETDYGYCLVSDTFEEVRKKLTVSPLNLYKITNS